VFERIIGVIRDVVVLTGAGVGVWGFIHFQKQRVASLQAQLALAEAKSYPEMLETVEAIKKMSRIEVEERERQLQDLRECSETHSQQDAARIRELEADLEAYQELETATGSALSALSTPHYLARSYASAWLQSEEGQSAIRLPACVDCGSSFVATRPGEVRCSLCEVARIGNAGSKDSSGA